MINNEITPVVQKPRRIPYHLMTKSEEKIKELLVQEIIEKVPDNEHRTWVSPPVIAPKPNGDGIRFCIDMRMANTAIDRPFTRIPTMEDVRTKFEGAQVFTKLDLKEAYHQIELSTASRHITTFYGPDGLYRYKRLNYGTKSAQDILQLEMQKLLSGIPNQVNIADDILIGGTQNQHDHSLKTVTERLNDKGNLKKCVFDMKEGTFVGLVFTKDGIKLDPKNVKNLHNMD